MPDKDADVCPVILTIIYNFRGYAVICIDPFFERPLARGAVFVMELSAYGIAIFPLHDTAILYLVHSPVIQSLCLQCSGSKRLFARLDFLR